MWEYEKYKLFWTNNKWLYLDWYKHRLTEKDSFNHLALISRTGWWKTTSFVVPNILLQAKQNCSMLITDISWEIYEKTSWYLAQNWYKILVLNPENLDESIRYNPYHYIKDSVDIDEVVTSLIESNKESQSKSNEFWEIWAKWAISIFVKYLFNKGIKKYINLANTRYLTNNFWTEWEWLKHLFEEIDDEKLQDEFFALTKINSNTLTSIIANANVALNPIGINDNLEKLTSSHTINFDSFRKQKTVLYIKIPWQKQSQYRFLLNTFYTQFFNHMMKKIPTDTDLPIYCLLDEFGNLNLSSFNTTITTIRKYRVSISIILQNIKQLENKYWKANAETILNWWITSKLFYSWSDLDTCTMLSKVIWEDENSKPIMTADKIRTMKDNEALFVMGNKLPVKFDIKPYYKNKKLRKLTEISPYKIEKIIVNDEIEYINLDE